MSIDRKEIKLQIGTNVVQTGAAYDWNLLSIDGEEMMEREISLEQYVSDGAYIKNERYLPRYITVIVQSKDASDALILARYIQAVDYFANEADCVLTVYSHGLERWINCKLHKRENLSSKWHKRPHYKLTLTCASPWMQEAEIENTFRSSIPLLVFPMTSIAATGWLTGQTSTGNEIVFDYNGQKENGFLLTLTATGAVTNPKVTNQNGDYVRVLDTLSNAEALTIDTRSGQKGVAVDGVTTKYDRLSTFFELEKGENTLTVSADSGIANLVKVLTYTELYRGI